MALILRRRLRAPDQFVYPGGAWISACGNFRYTLWRRWSTAPLLVFMMLNPSKADAKLNDPTIRKCIGFAKRMKFGGILVVNMFGYRATDPRDLKVNGWQDGDDNHMAVEMALQYCRDKGVPFVCAWGAQARKAVDHTAYNVAWAKAQKVNCIALALLADGTPQHPLMLPYDLEPRCL